MCILSKFIAIIVNLCVFFMQIFRMTILRFSSRTFFDFSSDIFTLSFFIFLWTHCSELKLVANIKLVAALER